MKRMSLASTTWKLPFGSGDTAYEADKAYYIQSHGTEQKNHPPDLAIEIVVSHPEQKALRAGALLKVPEMWVFDLPRRRLTFYHLAVRARPGAPIGRRHGAGHSRSSLQPRCWNGSTIRRRTTAPSTRTAGPGRDDRSSRAFEDKSGVADETTARP